MLTVLELLAGEEPLDRFEELIEDARRRGVTGAELEELERGKRLGLGVLAQLDRRQQREAGLSALVDTARELAVPYADLDALFKVVTRRARLLLGVDMAYLSLRDETEESYAYIRASDGHTSALNVGLRLPEGAGLGGAVMADPAPLWTPDYLTDESIEHNSAVDEVVRAEGLHAIMAVPLAGGTPPFGVLYAADRNVRHFTADEISLMTSLGDLAGVAIEKAQLLERHAGDAHRWEQRAVRCEADLRALRDLGSIHDRLIELVLGGGDIRALAEEARQGLDAALRVCAADGTVLTTAGEMPESPDGEATAVVAAAMDAHAAREPVPLDGGMWAAPIFAGAEHLGTVFVSPSRPFEERDQHRLRVTARAAAVLLTGCDRAEMVTVGNMRDELLDDLLTSPPPPRQQLDRRARRLGVDLAKPHLVVVARPEGDSHSKALTWASSYAHRMGGLKSMHDGSAVFLLPGTDAGAAARAVCNELSPLLGHRVTVGAAGPVADPGLVHHGYREAVRCLDAMVALGAAGNPASAQELGFLGVLLSDNLDVDGFIESAIGPVLGYDRQRFTDLTRTLGAYFDAGGSPTYAAEKLHVHPNTVARRLERIGELLGPGWQKPEHALEVQLALRLSRIRHLLRERSEPPGEE